MTMSPLATITGETEYILPTHLTGNENIQMSPSGAEVQGTEQTSTEKHIVLALKLPT